MSATERRCPFSGDLGAHDFRFEAYVLALYCTRCGEVRRFEIPKPADTPVQPAKAS